MEHLTPWLTGERERVQTKSEKEASPVESDVRLTRDSKPSFLPATRHEPGTALPCRTCATLFRHASEQYLTSSQLRAHFRRQ